MRIIIDCPAEDFDAAVRLIREELRDYERRYDRPGWGWKFPLAGGTCFVRGIKGGISLKADTKRQARRPPATTDEPMQAETRSVSDPTHLSLEKPE